MMTQPAASEQRQIIIRDAQGVVIGDHNVVYQYFLDTRYRPLAEHFISFDALIEERTERYLGREFVDDALTRFMARHDRGYFILAGEPGIGKTAWAANAVRQQRALHHFNIAAVGLNRAETCLENLSAQLIARFKLDRPYLPQGAGRNGALLAQLLHEASQRLDGDRLVLLIDGLDEVQMPAGDRGSNVLYLPLQLPAGVFIVVTRRLEPVKLTVAPGTPLETFPLSAELADNLADVRAYLRTEIGQPAMADWLASSQMPAGQFVAQLALASQGNFMYLAYVLADLAGQPVGSLNLSQLPLGLLGYYERFWEELETAKDEGPQAWRTLYKPVIGALAVAQEPVSAAWIAQMLNLDEEAVADFALERWRKFLERSQVGDRMLWRLYHRSFGDFLQDKLRGGQALHRQIVTHYLETYSADWSVCDGYGLNHLLRHVAGAALPLAQLAVALDQVLSDDYLQAIQARYWWLMPLVDDLSLAARLDPHRTVDVCLRIILGPKPNSLVIQQVLRLLVELRPAVGRLGNPRSSRHRDIDRAALLLAEGGAETLAALEALLAQVKNPRVKSVVALALGELGGRQATAVLLEMLKEARRQGSWAAADALIALGDGSIAPDLVDWYDRAGAAPDHERVLYILGWLHAPEARRLLDKALASSSPWVVGRGIDLTWLVGPEPGDLALLQEKADLITASDPSRPDLLGPWGHEWVQKRLVRALSRIGGVQALAQLRALQQHLARRGPPKDAVERDKLARSLAEALGSQ